MKRDAADIVDKIFAQVDPVVAAGGLLCAGAASRGITPPLTSLISALSDTQVQSSLMDALTWSPVSQTIGLLSGQSGIVSWADLFTGNYAAASPSDAERARHHQGAVLMAAYEGMLLMSLVRNEAALSKMMTLAGNLGSATIEAAGEAVPF